MDYEKLSEKSLDEIMQQIRIACGMMPAQKQQEVPRKSIQYVSNDGDFDVIDKYLADAVIGKQIGLHKAPMYCQKGIKRLLARLIEKIYLRVAELSNRDIRNFNSVSLSLFHTFKRALLTTNQNVTTLQQNTDSLQQSLMSEIEVTKEQIQNRIERLERDIKERFNEMEAVIKSTIQEKVEQLAQDRIAIQEKIEELMQDRTAILVEKNNQNELAIRRLNEQIVALKSVVNWASNEQFVKAMQKKVDVEIATNPLFYHDFEEKFRGTQEDIRERLKVYIPVITNHFETLIDKRFIDIGCGRGEWLDLLKENGIKNYIGVDLNEIQLGICREKGHPVTNNDCVEYIQSLEDSSVDMISGFQLIEHLTLETLMALLNACHRVLRPKGLILFETPNPNNLITAATYFYTDPTRIRPIHKDVAKFFLEKAGFTQIEVIEVNPVRYSKTLIKPTCFDGNQNVWNENIEILNKLLYGSQDYAILGVKA